MFMGWASENNRPLAKVHFATEVTEKIFLRGFPQRSLCTLWLLMQEVKCNTFQFTLYFLPIASSL